MSRTSISVSFLRPIGWHRGLVAILVTIATLIFAASPAVAQNSCSGSNATNVSIPDNVCAFTSAYSQIPISCAPAGATVTAMDVHAEVIHPYRGDVNLYLYTQDGTQGVILWAGQQGDSNANINVTFSNFSNFNGRPVNQGWTLWAMDCAAGDVGYIDYWSITVYYSSPPGPFTLSGSAYCNTTPPVAPAVSLSWTPSTGVSTYDLYRNGSLYSSNIPSSYTTFDNNANVTAGQSYTYFLRAKNASGTTDSNTITVSVPGNICGGSQPPASPTNLVANAISGNVALSWTDNSGNEDGFRIEQLPFLGSWSFIATVPANTISYQTIAPSLGQPYGYRVYAYNTSYNSAYSNEAFVWPFAAPTLSSPADGAQISGSSTTLQWNPVTGANSYLVQVGPNCGDTSFYDQTTTSTSVNLSGLSNGTYRWRVAAVNNAYSSASDFSSCRSFSVGSAQALCPLQSSPLVGLTVITHGWTLPSHPYPSWIYDMALAIANRNGGPSSVPIYNMRISDVSGQLQVDSFTPDPGTPSINLLQTPHVIVMIDWSLVASGPGDVFSCYNQVNASQIGQVAFNYLWNQLYSGHSLLELPLHLIGHSRGASVNSEIAFQLGKKGILIDHVTTLDSHPISGDCSDPDVYEWKNVLFADNYYRDSTGDYPYGESITGAYQLNLNSIINPGEYDCGHHWQSEFLGIDHAQVHTYYHGTVDLAAECVDDVEIQDDWYGGNRGHVGFYYSRLGMGNRLSETPSGLPVQMGGTAPRQNVNPPPGALWPNAVLQPLSNSNYTVGQQISINYHYQDADSGLSISFAFDDDTNPFNNDGNDCYLNLGSPSNFAPSADILPGSFLVTATNEEVGSHYIQIKAQDPAGRVRYDYLPEVINIIALGQSNSDLVVENLSVAPSSGQPGDSATVSFAIRNAGAGVAYASSTNLRFGSSSGSVTTSDAPLALGIAVPILQPGGTFGVTRTVTIPGQDATGGFYTSGQKYVWVILDVNSEANQGSTNEANDNVNLAYALVVPSPPSNIGDFVQVYSTLTSGLRVRSPNACDPALQGLNRFDGAIGKVVGGPQVCNFSGINYTMWNIQWSDCLDGWSAQNWMKAIPSATIQCDNDTTPPTVTISNPSDGQVFTNSPITVTGNSSDPGNASSGVVLVEIRVNNGSWQPMSGTTTWTGSLSLAAGPNTIEARSRDNAGNYSTIVAVAVTVNSSCAPPTAQCRNVTANLQSNQSVAVTADQVNNGSYPNGACTLSSVLISKDGTGFASNVSFGCGELGARTVTLRTTQSDGQTATCTATVTAADPNGYCITCAAPVASCKNTSINIGPNQDVSVNATQMDNGSQASSPCSLNLLQISKDGTNFAGSVSFGCADLGTRTVTLKARQSDGQTATCTAAVTVTDPGNYCSGGQCPPWTLKSSSGPSARFGPPGMAFDSNRNVSVLFGGTADGNNPLGDTWEWNGTSWAPRSPGTSPSARSGLAMAYDSARHVTVLFGGYNGNYLSDTWEWDGTNWSPRNPANHPPARGDHAMAYDSGRHKTVLFGGWNGSDMGDTWEWDGANWTQRSPATSPSARNEHALAYDARRGVTVLFAGWNVIQHAVGDTWEWDGTNWTQRSPATSPPAREFPVLAYDSVSSVVVLFGGLGNGVLSDTWEWHGTTWTQRDSTTSPPGRYETCMAFDSNRSVIVVFGGYQNGSLHFGDTWELPTCPDVTPPVVAIQSPVNGQVFSTISAAAVSGISSDPGFPSWGVNLVEVRVNGGLWQQASGTTNWSSNVVLNQGPNTIDARARDGAGLYSSIASISVVCSPPVNNCVTWTLESNGNPGPRAFHAMTFDTSRSVIVQFGGDDGSNNGETWEWNGSTWTLRATTGPTGRDGHAMVYDSGRGKTVLFGGSGNGLQDDTWEWNGTSWTQRLPAIHPPERYVHAMAYDSARGKTILFGGWNGSDLGDTWEWDGSNWTQLNPATSPPARHVHAMAFDTARNVIVLFGGYIGSSLVNDTWEWNGTTWTQRSPATSPSARHNHAMTYDSTRGVTVLFGGASSSSANTNLGDTWKWDGNNWTLEPMNGPSPRRGHRMAYDAGHGVTVLFGGYDDHTFLSDTWELEPCRMPCPASFGPTSNYTVGGNPQSMAMGDLNGDGKLDLAVANYNTNNVSVLLGNGDGTFQTAVPYAVGTNPLSVAIADLNSDGRQDLVVANFRDNNLSVLLGNGDGTFHAAPSCVTGSGPESVAIGDLNNDGRPDLAVANGNDNTLSVLFGNGDGTFQTAAIHPAGTQPQFVAIGDVNGDGRPDLVAANYVSNDVSVLLGNGNGTFQAAGPYPVGSGPRSVALGDLNVDGIPDLAVANSLGNSISVLMGNGDGTFQGVGVYVTGINPSSLAISDLNGDGLPDLAVANSDQTQSGGSSVSVLSGNGNGTFQSAVNVHLGSNAGALALGDLNGDGRCDLAVANGPSAASVVSILLNTSFLFGDINGDGVVDGRDISPFVAAVFTTSGSLIDICTADFDGNGIIDLGDVPGFVGALLGQ